jgi:hypothetical protein
VLVFKNLKEPLKGEAMDIWGFFEKVLNLIIREKPELTIYVLSMGFLMFMMLIMFLIVKKIIDNKG